LEIRCPGCGRVYPAEEVKELIQQIRTAGVGRALPLPGK
jgi:hypothetical protein